MIAVVLAAGVRAEEESDASPQQRRGPRDQGAGIYKAQILLTGFRTTRDFGIATI